MDDKIEIPMNWPANEREQRIQLVYDATINLLDNPTPSNKMALSSLVTPTDINEPRNDGLVRITAFEIQIINSLYLIAATSNLFNLRFYLLWHVYSTILSLRMASLIIPSKENLALFEPFNHLMPELHLFYVVYYNYRSEKKRDFVDVIIDEVNRVLNNQPSYEQIAYLEESFVNMIYTFSFLPDKKVFPIIAFSRPDLKKLFSICSTLLKKTGHSIMQRPYRGTISISVSNWIMNSRNEYNNNVLFKYMDKKVVDIAIENREIWMREIHELNDKREGKLIREIMKDKRWIIFDWAKALTIEDCQTTYVTSFSKSGPSETITSKYGSAYFGYKNDRISDLLAPAYRLENGNIYMESVRHYDVVYGYKGAKEELNFLFEIIDVLGRTDAEKNDFLNHIIHYWTLSFKDEKWSEEKERRYEITIHDQQILINSRAENDFLKIESPVFLYPDFVSPDIPKKRIVREHVLSNMFRRYYLCEDCLNREIEILGDKITECSRCRSNNITVIE